MIADKVTILKPKADVVLLPNVVGPQYILTIQVLPHGVSAHNGTTVEGASSYDQLRRPSLRAGMAYRHSVLS